MAVPCSVFSKGPVHLLLLLLILSSTWKQRSGIAVASVWGHEVENPNAQEQAGGSRRETFIQSKSTWRVDR